MMKKWLVNAFGFSKRELNGLLFLMLIILFVTLVPYLYRYYIDSQPKTDQNLELALQKITWINEREQARQNRSYYPKNSVSKNKVISYHRFDPNKSTVEEWQQFGLSYKQAMSIVNYVKKGGKFYKAEDLKKMYTISPQKYEALLPYIDIPAANQSDKKPTFSYAKKEAVLIDINSADTTDLDRIRGVGPSFARRIVKYRERLGGFYAKEQLFEVFGVDTAKFNEIKDQLKIDLNGIKKININNVEFDELKKHPYLKFKEMNAIIQYRKQHGPYKDMGDLNKVLILKPETIQKMAPYLDFK
jgi:competence ComEA-like helix-hairpin-helix protein